MRDTFLREVTDAESRLLDLMIREPQLVENLRRCTATQEHERSMLERLRLHLVRALGAQIANRKRG